MTKLEQRIYDEMDVEFIRHENHESIRGNCTPSGDAKIDERCASLIEKKLAEGNDWAWCAVECLCTWREIEAEEFLDCCACDDREEFETSERAAYMKRICATLLRDCFLAQVDGIEELLALDKEEAA